MDNCQTLLLIDPDHPSRELVQHAMARLDFLVTLANSGQEGIAQFSPELFHLVITDLHLPDMSGLEVLRKIKDVSPETPVVVLASGSDVSDVVEAMRLGASDYLLRPINDVSIIEHSISRITQAQALIRQNREYREELEKRNRELCNHIDVLQKDQQAGRLLQQHLLPRTPYQYPAGIEAAYRLVPSLFLSGDFIDYGLFGERFVAFYLVDVSGHGASSALVTALIKHSVIYLLRERSLFAQLDTVEKDLLDILKLVNDELMSVRLDKIATMFVGVIDSRARQLYYTTAGQVPMPALITDQGVEWLPGKGRPLGLFKNGDWQVRRTNLPCSWRLVACSDGVLELLEGDDLLQREARLLEVIGQSGGDLENLCTALHVDSLDALPDDITILTLRQG